MAVQHMSHLKNALLGLALIGAVIGLFGLFQILGDDADLAEAKAAVVKRLKDPDSARFSDLVKTGGGYIVCGKVNAKNGFGGYTGAKSFAYFVLSKHLSTEGEVSLLAVCRP
jgi:hypothetical protein